MLNTWKPSKAQEEVTDFCHSMFGSEPDGVEGLGAPLFPHRFELLGCSIGAFCLPKGRSWLGRTSVMLAKRIDFRWSAVSHKTPGGGGLRTWRLIAGRWSVEISRAAKVPSKRLRNEDKGEAKEVAESKPSSFWVGSRNFTWVRLQTGCSWHSSGGEPGEAVIMELSCSLYEGGALQSDYLIRRLIAGRWNICTQVAI